MSGKCGDVDLLSLSMLLSVHRRNLFIDANLSPDARVRRMGRATLQALERLRREEAEDDGGDEEEDAPTDVQIDERYRKRAVVDLRPQLRSLIVTSRANGGRLTLPSL